MKFFLVPCFVVTLAKSKEDADFIASTFQKRQPDISNSHLLLDEELPTTEIPKPIDEFPHTMLGIVKQIS